MKTPDSPSEIGPGQRVVVDVNSHFTDLKGVVHSVPFLKDLEGVVQSRCDNVGYATITVRIFGREVPLAVEWTKIRIKE
jgi:hypothetical protein